MSTTLKMKSAVILALFIVISEIGSSCSQCPCEPATLCDPITNTTRKEVFAFVQQCDNATWSKFDWGKLTTIVLDNFYDPQLYCHAKANNVRVVNLADIPVVFCVETSRFW